MVKQKRVCEKCGHEVNPLYEQVPQYNGAKARTFRKIPKVWCVFCGTVDGISKEDYDEVQHDKFYQKRQADVNWIIQHAKVEE